MLSDCIGKTIKAVHEIQWGMSIEFTDGSWISVFEHDGWDEKVFVEVTHTEYLNPFNKCWTRHKGRNWPGVIKERVVYDVQKPWVIYD